MNQANQLELVSNGTVEMLKPILLSFGSDLGTGCFDESFSICGPMYQYYRIFSLEGNHPDIGIVETQQLSRERVLITIDAKPRDGNVTDEQKELFKKFTAALLTRLAQLGFVELPELPNPKKPLGFGR